MFGNEFIGGNWAYLPLTSSRSHPVNDLTISRQVPTSGLAPLTPKNSRNPLATGPQLSANLTQLLHCIPEITTLSTSSPATNTRVSPS